MKSYVPSEKLGGTEVKEVDRTNAIIFATGARTVTYTVPEDGIIAAFNNGTIMGLTTQVNGETITGYADVNSFREIVFNVSSGDVVYLTSTNNAWVWRGAFYPYAD